MSEFGQIFTTSYESTLVELRAALLWLGAIGISHSATRFHSYERLLVRYQAKSPEDRAKLIRSDHKLFFSANMEVEEVLKIYRGLAGKYDAELIEHVKRFAGGPELYADENTRTSSNRGRDVAVELSLMAELAAAGLKLDFSAPVDVAANFRNRLLLFECKRPQSSKTIISRYKEAVDQLSRTMEQLAAPRMLGYVLIDLTKVVNPKMIVRGYSSRQDMLGRLHATAHSFTAQLSVNRFRAGGRRPVCLVVRLRDVAVVPSEFNADPHSLDLRLFRPPPDATPLEMSITEELVAATNATRANAA